jgi:hypothetical protein
MKTIYLIKPFVPFLFLPFAPGVMQAELERLGLIPHGSAGSLTIFLQVVLLLGVVSWIARAVAKRKQQSQQAKAFLTMSCVSKKVLHNGKWMSVEQYLADHHNVVVSHGMTPEEANNWMRESEEYLAKEKQGFRKREVSVS